MKKGDKIICIKEIKKIDIGLQLINKILLFFSKKPKVDKTYILKEIYHIRGLGYFIGLEGFRHVYNIYNFREIQFGDEVLKNIIKQIKKEELWNQ